jgi:ArsR family transcriptional regulator, arsenate/arsenite/antimonite-responsive transcriptional repressor
VANLLERNAECFKALGHPIRLAIIRLIVQGSREGTPAGEIQDSLGIPASTLSHHLACLSETRLVQVERDGTTLRYRADFPTLHALVGYLWEDCCKGGMIQKTCAAKAGCCSPSPPKPATTQA